MGKDFDREVFENPYAKPQNNNDFVQDNNKKVFENPYAKPQNNNDFVQDNNKKVFENPYAKPQNNNDFVQDNNKQVFENPYASNIADNQWNDGFGQDEKNENVNYESQRNIEKREKAEKEKVVTEQWNDGFDIEEDYETTKKNDKKAKKKDSVDLKKQPPVNGNVPPQNMNPPMNGSVQPQNMNPPMNGSVQPQNMNPPMNGSVQPQNMNPPMNGNIPPQNMRPPMNGGVPPQNMRPPMNGGVPPQNMRPPMNGGVPPQNMNPPMNGSVPPQNMRPPMNGGVPPQNMHPPMNGNVPPQNMHPPMNGNVPPQNMHPPMRNYYMPIQKIYDKTDRHFSWIAFLLGFLFIFNIVSVEFRFGIGATISSIAEVVISYIYVYRRNIKINLVHNICAVFLILLSIPFTIYSNRLIGVVNFFVIMFGITYWVYTAGGESRKHHGGFASEFITGCFAYPFMNYGSMFGAVFGKNKDKKSGNAKWIIVGILIAVPIVCFVSFLLLESDKMFSTMFSFIFDNFLSKFFKYVFYALVGLPIAMGFFSCWYTKFDEDRKLSNNVVNRISNGSYIAPPVLMYSITIPICVVYFLYLVSQVSYFISFIADNLLPKDYTIVDYARNGFFELCVVAVINVIIIALLLGLTKRINGEKPFGVKVITVIMSSFTIVFIATALYKMFTYISKYGYTSMRINTSVFMIFLLIVFVLVIINQFVPKLKMSFVIIAFAMAFIGVYNLIDTDSIIARENIRLYQQGQIKWMGSYMLRELDDSAYEYLVEFAESGANGLDIEEKHRMNKEIGRRYYDLKYYEEYYEDDGFVTFNFTRYRIYNILKDYCNSDTFRKYNDEYKEYENDYYRYGESYY